MDRSLENYLKTKHFQKMENNTNIFFYYQSKVHSTDL